MQRCTSRPWIATGLILLACLARPSLAQENPNGLVADVRNPYTGTAETLSDWCVPNHWTPWNGDWACDVWKDNGAYGVGQHPNPSCGRDVYLKVSPSMLPGWVVPDRLRAKVINVSHHGFACGNQNYSYGGYQQAFEIYATYDGVEIALGWVLYAHLDNLVYNFGDWIADPMNVRIGTVFQGDIFSNCWGGCHVHMEFNNYRHYSCYQIAPPWSGIPALGENSVIGKLGGRLGSTQRCPACNSEAKACSTWDMDVGGCDQHGISDSNPTNDTQDCAYYFDTSKCRPRGTSNCAAGCTWCWDCNGSSETLPCSTWDGDVNGCDQHGLYDSNPTNDTQDCGYYFDTGRCAPRGTSNCATGCTWCWDCANCSG